MVVDAFSAAQLSAAGAAHQTYRLAGPGGVMPNSVYYTLPDRLDELHEPLVAFLGALQEAMDAITGGAPTAGLLASHWPDVGVRARAAATAELIENGTWDTVVIDKDATNRWVGILRDAGLLSTGVSFDTLVDTRVVDKLLTGGGS
jgi:NitT/TauT family transport system substrate-binding protein